MIDVTGRHAALSDDKKYRYNLYRSWREGSGMIVFVMLNPSTADAEIDDPTIRRCIGFAQREEFSSLMVGNVFGYRATDPKELILQDDPVGPDNYKYLQLMMNKADAVCCAWGAHKMNNYTRFFTPVDQIIRSAGIDPECLGTNKDGSPKHPLYLPEDAEFEEFQR